MIALAPLLAELEQFGIDNDASISERPRRMLNITRDTGEFLSVLVRSMGAQRVLEIGTSNGYSTLWLADAVRAVGGRVATVEMSAYKRSLAEENFRRSGLAPFIEQIADDAGDVLRNSPDESVDFLFLDSERSEYVGWWPHIKRVLRHGGLLVVDNATSHAAEMEAFCAMVEADGEFSTCLVPIGNGEFMAVRAP